MQIQKISNQNVKNKTLPAEAVVIQLLGKDEQHLAYIACHHEQIFALFDSENDREESHFLEEISNFEAEILIHYFGFDHDMKKRFGGFTGEMIITDKKSEIIYHQNAA